MKDVQITQDDFIEALLGQNREFICPVCVNTWAGDGQDCPYCGKGLPEPILVELEDEV